ncbi:MAG: type II secretion system F family protein [Myxococcota bacterium]|nr:type II secretion system F family protein [Myxococcota bacterium]
MDLSLSISWMSALGLALLGVGLLALTMSQLGNAESPTLLAWRRYVAIVDRDGSFVHLPLGGARFAALQLAVVIVLAIAASITRQLVPLFLVPLVIGLPLALLRRARDRRVAGMEEQLDGWMMGLANTLRATPALGEALEYSARMVGAPISEEFDLLLKERKLGVPLDDALRNSGDRIGSRTIRAVLSTLIIARNTGGSLPDILEVSAAQLREMARLDGVIRTKTAEGRGQAWVLALMPFGMLAGISAVDHDFFAPLMLSLVGWIVIAIAVLLWLVAIGTAVKILEIDV